MVNNRLDFLEGDITGPQGTPYEGGTWKVDIEIPDKYPLDPPKVSKLYYILDDL